MSEQPNYITPAGFRMLREEYDALYAGERPKLLETIAWAASNGDRSENADYHYGRKRLREVDRRINFLARRMKEAKVTDPARQGDRTRIWFGATVTLAGEDGGERMLTLVGEDEAEAEAGKISWYSPIARAVRGRGRRRPRSSAGRERTMGDRDPLRTDAAERLLHFSISGSSGGGLAGSAAAGRVGDAGNARSRRLLCRCRRSRSRICGYRWR